MPHIVPAASRPARFSPAGTNSRVQTACKESPSRLSPIQAAHTLDAHLRFLHFFYHRSQLSRLLFLFFNPMPKQFLPSLLAHKDKIDFRLNRQTILHFQRVMTLQQVTSRKKMTTVADLVPNKGNEDDSLFITVTKTSIED